MFQSQWLTIHAGGRRKVLRQLVPTLLCLSLRRCIDIQDFYFHWEGDQPALRLCLSRKKDGDQNFHQAIIQIEQALDAVMTSYPWEELPVLDWVGEAASRKLSITLETPDLTMGKSKVPTICPFEVAQKIYLLIGQDGTVIKDAWVHVLHLAITMYPELFINRHELLEYIPSNIRELIPVKLAWIERNIILAHEEPPLWVAMCNLMSSMEMGKRQELLQSVADRLGFRPDEQAYLMLVASVVKSQANGER